MPRVVTISPEAERVMFAEFKKRTPAAIIVRLVAAATGETVAARTIARRAATWRAEQMRVQAAREQMTALVQAAENSDLTAEGMLRALAFTQLLENPKAMGADPVALQELRIKEKAVDLKARQIAVEEGKLKLLQDRERKAVAAAEDLAKKAERGETISPEDLQKIKDIYGLRDDSDN
ncbi:MAG: hypothetical protein KGL39_11385 [Patescibacteria group bacterium]|nr:hypothetical protein [Patescibacteria group bacterium]